ncbi:MAG TPA: hypothetical protein P5513_07305 [Candidatus Diapherotrites archaeon]|nr:hypothetical protein [Candidatus Diapherotrites archaeon]
MIKGAIADVSSKNDNYLTIILDDEEEVISSIEKAFKERDVKKAVLISAEGKLKNTRLSITRAGSIRQRTYDASMIIKSVYGEFNKVNNDYVGDINISLYMDPLHVTNGILLKGFADGECKFVFKIIQKLEYALEDVVSKTQGIPLPESAPKEKKPFIISG